MHNPSKNATGMTSDASSRGGFAAIDAQKVLTPKRIKDSIEANPDSTIRAISVQVKDVMTAPGSSGLSKAWNMLNLARKPDRGGRPAIISAQPKNDRPRNASAAGTPTPAVSSGSSSTANASMVSASIAAPGELMRLINSISSMRAATATVEPTR